MPVKPHSANIVSSTRGQTGKLGNVRGLRIAFPSLGCPALDFVAVSRRIRICPVSKKAGAAQASYLRSALVAKPGIMNTMEMAKPTISTVLKSSVLAMVLMAMLTTVEPTYPVKLMSDTTLALSAGSL